MSEVEPPRLRVGVIGAGRVGSVLGAALAAAGHHIVAATAVSAASRARARRMLPTAVIYPPEEVLARSELVLLTVPDDDLPGLVSGLASAGAWRSGQIVAHTSGAHGLDVLTPASAYGVLPLALHPAMTFTGRAEDVDRLTGTVFGITADPDYRAVAEALVIEMQGESVWVPEHARALYHAALSHAANHVVTLLCDATDLLAGAGVENPTRMLTPLVNAAVDNAFRLSDGALTGPVSRGDAVTVAAHVRALAREDPAVLPSYAAMARRTAERAAAARRISDADYGRVLAALADTDPLGAVEAGRLDLGGAWPDAPEEASPAASFTNEDDASTGDVTQDDATGDDATGNGPTEDGAIGDGAIGGDAIEDDATGGGATEDGATEDDATEDDA